MMRNHLEVSIGRSFAAFVLIAAAAALTSCDQSPPEASPAPSGPKAIAAAPSPETGGTSDTSGASVAPAVQAPETPPVAKEVSNAEVTPIVENRPDWVRRFGNDPRESFPTVRRGGSAWSDTDRLNQNERMIEFWRAHRAGDASALNVEYISGAHGLLAYWRLVTEDGQARLVKLMRSGSLSERHPRGGPTLVWRLGSEEDISKIRFGRLTWRDEQPTFREAKSPFEPKGDSFGFAFEVKSDSETDYFPPILTRYKPIADEETEE